MTDTYHDLEPGETLPKLKPAIKKRWLKALRSGKYQQAEKKLCQADPATGEPVGYCCLGVLADVVKDDKGLGLEWTLTRWTLGAYFEFDGQEGEPSVRIARHVLTAPAFVGLFDGDNSEINGAWGPLMQRNDGYEGRQKHNFEQIADLIERRM